MDDEDVEDQNLSIRLYRIMDTIWASEYTRGLCRETSLFYERLESILSVHRTASGLSTRSMYIFGSRAEGTTTLGLCSDVDMVNYDDSVDVIDNIEDAAQNILSLLMVTDENTRPGYFYLQKVIFGIPQTTGDNIYEINPDLEATDPFGRICFTRRMFPTTFYQPVIHGPAYTCPGYPEQDYVFAYRCKKVPGIVKAWLYRERPCGWPSQQQLKAMESYGCFFVPVGHPRSPTKSLEWRISFSLQERELMFGLNETQHKCYILLKMIKKDIIQPKVGPSISSYHCKTCLFYAIQTSTHLVWTHENLIKCTRLCLELLLQWVREGNCPNYFIPEENMFDKLDKETLRNVAPVLEGILASDSGFLFDLKCDHIGSLLCTNPSEVDIKNIELDIRHTSKLHFVLFLLTTILFARNHFIRTLCRKRDAEKHISSEMSLLKDLQNMVCINEHTQEDVRATMDLIIPHIHLQVAQCVTSDILCDSEMHDPNFVSRALVHHFLGCNNVDLFSARLILASFCLKSDRFDICKEILRSCELSLKDYVISFCACYAGLNHKTNSAFRAKISADGPLNLESVSQFGSQFGSQCTTGCIAILPSQANLVHKVLHYEMYRSVYTPAGSRDKDNHSWFDWIVLDSQIYLYFLQYLLYSQTNQPLLKIECVTKLHYVIKNDPNLGHRETAYNLLGWIFTQEKLFENAFLCFLISLKLRPQHNAAKWHIAFLLHELIYSP